MKLFGKKSKEDGLDDKVEEFSKNVRSELSQMDVTILMAFPSLKIWNCVFPPLSLSRWPLYFFQFVNE
jgi:hypothetical protein